MRDKNRYFGARISAARARWLACDGNITRIVIGPDGQPLDVGRTKRVFPPHIRRALEHGAELSPYPYLKVGRRARVTAGPFRDIEGMIEKFPKPDRLILQIEALGRATSLEIDAGLLEPVDWS